MATIQSGYGKIKHFIDFTGEDVPVAGTVQVPIHLGNGFKLVGEVNNADDGVVLQDALNGVGRITTTDEDTLGLGVAMHAAFDPAKMAPLVLETRVSLPAQTSRNVFIGWAGALSNTTTEIVTGGTTTVTYASTTGDNVAGFMFDSQLTSKNWHIVYKGGTASAPTTTALCDSSVLPVNDIMDILRVIIMPDGAVEWWINGNFIRRVEGAVSTTVNYGPIVGVFSTTTTVATLDCDYVAVEANRNWNNANT